jgi:hypothetical protein
LDADFYTVNKNLTIPANSYFIGTDSSQCGYLPGGTGVQKGYASTSTSGTNVTMFTYTICLKYNTLG